jgi:serine phosphatase RsbU (regulator of sigma subunit)
MKKAIRIFGILTLCFFVIGYTFKMLHFPGAGPIFLLSMLFFDLFYLPFQLIYDFRKEKKTLNKIYFIIRFLFLFMLLTSFTFKMMHWPGARILFISAEIFILIYFTFYFIRRSKEKIQLQFSFNDLMLTIMGIIILHFVNNSTIGRNVLYSFLYQAEQYKNINQGIKAANDILYSSVNQLSNTEENESIISSLNTVRIESDSIHFYLKEFQYRLIEEIEGWDRTITDSSFLYDIEEIDEFKRTYMYLFGDIHGINPKSNKYSALGFKFMINEYVSTLKKVLEDEKLYPNNIGLGLDTQDQYTRWGDRISWEDMYFSKFFASVISNIAYLENLIYMSEYNTINQLLSKLVLSNETEFIKNLALKSADDVIESNKKELTLLKQNQKLHELEMKEQQSELRHTRMINLLAVIVVLFVVVLLIMSTRAYKGKKKDNQILEEQKQEIEDKKNSIEEINEELKQQNEEILSQRDEIEAQRNEIQFQKEEIEKAHQHTEESIIYAKRIQSAILPPVDYIYELIPDHFILYMPRDIVSGDYYWIKQIHDQMVIVAADCTGHGVPGAFMSMLGISFLNEIVMRREIIHTGEILKEMRKQVKRSLRQTGKSEEAKDGMDMAVCVINTKTNIMQYSGAYNSVYIIRDKELIEIKADRMPVGIHGIEKAEYTDHQFQLSENDIIYLFSDGFQDQFGGPKGKKYLTKRFKAYLLSIHDLTMSSQKQQLEKEINAWKKGYEQTDDILVMGFKI